MATLEQRRSKRRSERGRGQALVEFALVIPVFFLLLSGVLDFGFLLYSRMTVINAAREAAHAGAVVDPAVVTAISRSTAESAASGMSVTVATSCVAIASSGSCAFTANGAKPGDGVRVTVSYTHHTFFPLLFGATVPLSATVQMVME